MSEGALAQVAGRSGVLSLGRKPRIGLLGDGVGMYRAAKQLMDSGYPLVVMLSDHTYDDYETSVKAQKESYGLIGNPEEFAREYTVPFVRHSDLNAQDVLETLKYSGAEVLLTFGPRTIFKGLFLEQFKDRILNIHTAPLPKYRGGACDSWMILNGETEAYGVCHTIEAGIDSGPIWAKMPYSIHSHFLPIDIYTQRLALIPSLVVQALDNYLNADFEPELQDLSKGFYLPKLLTPRDGGIDWSRSAQENERFVRAFSLPYSGAWTHCDGQLLTILRASCVPNDQYFHPFSNGTVIRQSTQGWHVVSGGDVLEIWNEQWTGSEGKRLLGKRLSTQESLTV